MYWRAQGATTCRARPKTSRLSLAVFLWPPRASSRRSHSWSPGPWILLFQLASAKCCILAVFPNLQSLYTHNEAQKGNTTLKNSEDRRACAEDGSECCLEFVVFCVRLHRMKIVVETSAADDIQSELREPAHGIRAVGPIGTAGAFLSPDVTELGTVSVKWLADVMWARTSIDLSMNMGDSSLTYTVPNAGFLRCVSECLCVQR